VNEANLVVGSEGLVADFLKEPRVRSAKCCRRQEYLTIFGVLLKAADLFLDVCVLFDERSRRFTS
jgi:hypothetical protein